MNGEQDNSESEDEKKFQERLRELERNSIYYTQLRYILGALIESSDPHQILATVLQEIATMTGGSPSLAVEFQEGTWEIFSLPYFRQHDTWYPRHLVNSEIYSSIFSLGETYYNLQDAKPSNLPDKVKRYITEIDAKTIIFLPFEGTPKMIVEVRNVIIPDRIERYLEASKEFFIPLRLSIQHAMLLEDSKRARRRSDLLLDLLFHDIRGSIGSLTIILELMAMKWDDSAKTYGLLHDALAQSKEANDLLNRVRRVLTAQIKQKLSSYNLEKAIESSISTIKSSHPEANIRIVSQMGTDTRVLADELLQDVFINLLSNALKALENKTEEIIIEIDCWKQSSEYVRVRVIDKGRGIPENIKPRIAGRFLTDSVDGIGLGLSIVMRIIEDYGGYLWFENRIPEDWQQGTIANVALRLAED
ncbi:MAG: sensor histidine kinase [Candidatus Thorarchaeota archaeon]